MMRSRHGIRALIGLKLLLLFSGRALASGASIPTDGEPTIPACPQSLVWRGENDRFWKKLGREQFERIVQEKGLSNYKDLMQSEVLRLLGLVDGSSVPQTVAVIGAGYGRELDFLHTQTDVHRIHAIEVGSNQVTYLRSLYQNDRAVASRRGSVVRRVREKEVIIYEENIADWAPALGTKVQLALWMFAGILELSPNEKLHAIKRLHETLTPAGVVVVDVPLGPVKSSLHIVKGTDTIRFSLTQGGDEHLNWHPINHASGCVNVDKITDYFVRDNMFYLYRTKDYRTESEQTQKRRLLFFLRP